MHARRISISVLLGFTLACAEGAAGDEVSTSYTSAANDEDSAGTDESGSDSGTPAFCGDQTCDAPSETCQTCVADCGACSFCGDEVCSASGGENCMTCPLDCDVCPGCGNGTCEGNESCASCPADCTEGCTDPFCGDHLCNGTDTCENCSEDCGLCAPFCGDDSCNGGEDCASCEQDCGSCAGCPNGQCGEGESCQSCAADCGQCTCPCNPNDPNFNNFCYYGPNTAGCPMTLAGGYCDPNGDGSYQDGDWNLGYYEYLAQCG